MKKDILARMISLLLIVGLLLSLGACTKAGGKDPTGDAVATTEATEGDSLQATESTEPSTEQTEPATEPTAEPTVEPTETAPVETEKPTEPATTPTTEPTTAPTTEPTAAATVPATEPTTEPPTATTEPATEPPTEPATEPTQAHTHSYKASGTTAPTCTSDGHTTYRCSCGDSYKGDTVKATGHSWGEWEETRRACIYYEGEETRTCSTCGTQEKRAIPMLEDPKLEDIETAVVKYINQFRVEEGKEPLTYLPGMSEVARYRCSQVAHIPTLTRETAHNEADERAAYNACQYGEPDEDGNYNAHATEAYCSWTIGMYSTADSVGYNIASRLHNSSGHWSYLGSSFRHYIGVGCGDGNFHCYVIVGTTNYG